MATTTKGQKEMESGADQVKGGARQAQAGAEGIAQGVRDEAARELGRIGRLPGALTERGREVWLAGLGALSAVEEEGSQFFEGLIDRGAKLEKRGRDQINTTVSELGDQQKQAYQWAGDTAEGTLGRLEETVTAAIQRVFGRFDVPTQAEVQELSGKVDQLARKLDGLAVTLEKQADAAAKTTKADETAVYRVVPRDEEGWAVERQGAQRATGVYDTKKEAVENGRELARGHAPSELLVYKQGGSVQETFTYDEEEA